MKIDSGTVNENKAIHFDEVNNSNANLISGKFSISIDTNYTLLSSSLFISVAPLDCFDEIGKLVGSYFIAPHLMKKSIVFEFKKNQINIYWDKRKIKEFNNISFVNNFKNRISFEINYSDNNAKISLGINNKYLEQVILPNVIPYKNRVSFIAKGKSRLEVDGIRISYIEYTNIKSPTVLSQFSSNGPSQNSLELKPYSSNLFDTTIINLEFDKEIDSQLSLSLAPQVSTNNQSGLTFTFMSADIINIMWQNKLLESIKLPKSFFDQNRKTLKILITQVPEGHQLSFYTDKTTAIKDIFVKGFYPYSYKTIISGVANKSNIVDNGKTAINLKKIELYNFNQTIDKLFVLDGKYFSDRTTRLTFSPKNMKVFQGLINKKIPRIFFIENQEDIFWLEKINQYYGIKTQEATGVIDLYLSVKDRVNEVGKFIVYKNDDKLSQINSAATYAGQTESFILNEEEYIKVGYYFQKVLKLRKIDNWAPANNFLNHTLDDIQKWMYENLINNSNPITFFMAPVKSTYEGFDYAVAKNLFWMTLDSKGLTLKDYATTQMSILKYFPPTGALGRWTSEVQDIEAISKYGHTSLQLSSNTTVYSFLLRPKNFTQQININNQNANQPIDINAKYVFLSFSQGDSLQFCLEANLRTFNMISCIDPSKTLGQLYNFGMMCSTLAYYFNPTLLQYFYNSQNNVLFSAKGYGYNNPSTLISNGFKDLLVNKSKMLMYNSGNLDFMLNDRTISEPSNEINNKIVAEIITKDIRPRSILFKHVFNKNLSPGTTENIVLNNVPIFQDPIMVHPDENLFETIREKPPCEQANLFDFSNEVNMIISSSKVRQFQWVFLDHQMSTNPEFFEKFYIQLSEKIQNDKLNIKIVNGADFFKAFEKIKMNQN